MNSSPKLAAVLLLAVTSVGRICLVDQAAAQSPTPSSRPTLSGIVMDASSGAAIPGAAVILTERAAPVFSDRYGRFSFPDVQPGTRTLIVKQLGYDSLRTDVEFAGSDEPLLVHLVPDPIALERIDVVVDGFARRAAMGSRILDQVTLQNSGGASVLDIVLARTGIARMPCPERLAMTPCGFVRGRVVPVRVFVDGASIISGLDMLASLPPTDLHYLEIVSGGRTIRVYTTWYMETVASGRRVPAEFLY